MGFTPTKMAAFVLFLCCCTSVVLQMANAFPAAGKFQDYYTAEWGSNHISLSPDGTQANLRLDQESGAGFESIQSYIYGYFSVEMKLVPGYSAGTVSSFYISSAVNPEADTHDEIDFEFLGNVSGQPYSLSTNLFAGGHGGREQKFNLWFDPTADFHTYAVIWNHALITWLIDNIPVRVFKNLQAQGLAYPSGQTAQVLASFFDGSGWATSNGGTFIPVDYNYAPFLSSYSSFAIDACVNNGVNVPDCETNYGNNWWEGSQYTSLTSDQISQLQSIQANYVYYDYCKDSLRYPNGNDECSFNYN